MKNNNRLYVDIHVLQTVPPSCVNRDDTGSPKTAVYGGVNRSRVSSQSWKRAMRTMFKDAFNSDMLGVRSLKIVGLLEEEIAALDSTVDANAVAQLVLETAGLTMKAAKDGTMGTGALFFISYAQVKALAKLAVDEPKILNKKPSKEAKAKAQLALKQQPGIDIALFGRMVADDPFLNTDACAQVAHSISTHKVSNEYDYFTAVDDLQVEDNAGAGHIGTVEFNSSTLYRYATIAVHELNAHLGGDTLDAVGEFVRAFACSMPTGKQNTFANRTLPSAMLVCVRKDQPINLVGAFEKPVHASDNGYVDQSVKQLVAHAQDVYQSFAGAPVCSLASGKNTYLNDLADSMQINDLIAALKADLSARLESDGDQP